MKLNFTNNLNRNSSLKSAFSSTQSGVWGAGALLLKNDHAFVNFSVINRGLSGIVLHSADGGLAADKETIISIQHPRPRTGNERRFLYLLI